MYHGAFFNSIIDKYQHIHFFTFNTVLVLMLISKLKHDKNT